MKQLLIPSLIVTSLALAGCASTNGNDDVSINPAFVQTKTLPVKQTAIQPSVTQPTYQTVKRSQGMVPLVTQADVKSPQPAAQASERQPHRIIIHETYHPVNPVTTGMVEVNGKTLPLAHAPQYIHTLQQQHQAYLNKANTFTQSIEHIYIGNQELTPVQTQALLHYMESQKHPLHYNNLQNLHIKPGMKFDLRLNHIIVNGQTLTGPAAMGFVNGLVASSSHQQAPMHTITPAHHTAMPMPQHATPTHPTVQTAPYAMMPAHPAGSTMNQHMATGHDMSSPHSSDVSHQEPMHYHMPPTPASATPTTSVVQQPQQNTGS